MIRGASIIALLYALYYIVPYFAFTFEDCGSNWGNVTNVSVSGCNVSQERCILVRGTNSTISVKFIPRTCIFYFHANVIGEKYNIPVPFIIHNTSMCEDPNSGLRCPLCTNIEYSFNVTMFVQPQFPNDFFHIDVIWEFYVNHGMTVLCIKYPAEVVKPNDTTFHKEYDTIFHKEYEIKIKDFEEDCHVDKNEIC